MGAFSIAALPYVFAFFAGEFFSTLGTTLAIGAKAGLTDAEGNLPGIEKPFLVDSLAATLGPLIGIPAGTALVESAAGVEAGGRTGLTPITAAILFLARCACCRWPWPSQAGHRAGPDPDRHLDAGHDPPPAQRGHHRPPARHGHGAADLISNSFGTGIAGGLLVHVIVQVLAGKAREIPIGLLILSIPLGYYFYTAATH
jgi:AGZA family xanthine/uracil permease-like MFS transporter